MRGSGDSNHCIAKRCSKRGRVHHMVGRKEKTNQGWAKLTSHDRDCAGDNTATCIHVSLINGTGNLDGTATQQTGVVRCSYSSPTTFLTQTSTLPSTISTGQSLSDHNSVTASTGAAASAPSNGSVGPSPTASVGTTTAVYLTASGRSLNPTGGLSMPSTPSTPSTPIPSTVSTPSSKSFSSSIANN